MYPYAYLIGSLGLLAVWFLIYLSSRAQSRKEMLVVSFGTMLLGLTEPIFVPEYWNPPTLFNLAQRISLCRALFPFLPCV